MLPTDARVGSAIVGSAKCNNASVEVYETVRIVDYTGLFKSISIVESVDIADDLLKALNVVLTEQIIIEESWTATGRRSLTIRYATDAELDGDDKTDAAVVQEAAQAVEGKSADESASASYDGPRTPDIYDYRYRRV